MSRICAATWALRPTRRSPTACGASSTGSAPTGRRDAMSVGTASLENAMSRPQDAPRSAFVRRHLGWVLFLLMLAVFAAGRLVGPRIPDDQQKYWCAINVRITAQLGVSLNCDSPEFMRVAARPSLLLGTSTPMQSRGSEPISPCVVALPLQPLASLVPHLVIRPERADIDQARVA